MPDLQKLYPGVTLEMDVPFDVRVGRSGRRHEEHIEQMLGLPDSAGEEKRSGLMAATNERDKD